MKPLYSKLKGNYHSSNELSDNYVDKKALYQERRTQRLRQGDARPSEGMRRWRRAARPHPARSPGGLTARNMAAYRAGASSLSRLPPHSSISIL